MTTDNLIISAVFVLLLATVAATAHSCSDLVNARSKCIEATKQVLECEKAFQIQ